MKTKQSQILLVISISIFGSWASKAPELNSAPKNRQTSASGIPAAELQPFTLKELIAASPDGQSIECAKILPSGSRLGCQAGALLPSPNSEGTSGIPITLKATGEGKGWIALEYLPDPALLERRVSSQKLVMGLDRSQVMLPESWAVGKDYVATVLLIKEKSDPNSEFALIPTKIQLSTALPSDFLKALKLIHYLHSKGIVGLNFELQGTTGPEGFFDLIVGKLNCAVRMGDPVGKWRFDPRTTDPTVLESDGTIKADIAMDYYALGIVLLDRRFPLLSTGGSEDVKHKRLDGLKNQGFVTFDVQDNIFEALLISFLIQKDRAARSDLSKIQVIIDDETPLCISSQPMPPLTYDPSVDPLTIPEFKKLIEDETSCRARKRAYRIGNSIARALPYVLGLLLLGGIIFLAVKCFGRKGAKEEEAADVNTELQDGGQPNPQVVMAN